MNLIILIEKLLKNLKELKLLGVETLLINLNNSQIQIKKIYNYKIYI